MNTKIILNGETISEGTDNYGAGGAYPARGREWAAECIKDAVASLIAPDADDADAARAAAGEITVTFTLGFRGSVKSARGVEKVELIAS